MNHPIPKRSQFQFFSNSWARFLGYVFRRNLGFFQRKTLNLLNELAEFACLAWVLDLGYLQSFLVIPMGHWLINYCQEFHWQLFRFAPKRWFEKRFCLLDYGLLAMTTMVAVTIWFYLSREVRADSLLLTLFGIRLGALCIQSFVSISVVRLTALRRVRPNVPLLWGSSLLVGGVMIALSQQTMIRGAEYVVWVAIAFNSLKVLHEVSYLWAVQAEKNRLRFSAVLADQKTYDKGYLRFAAGLVLSHLAVLVSFSFSLQSTHSVFSAGLVILLVTFLDRMNSRPFRSLAVDLIRLEHRRHFIWRKAMSRRVVLFSLIVVSLSLALVLKQRYWNMATTSGFIILSLGGVLMHAFLFSALGKGERSFLRGYIRLQSLAAMVFLMAALFSSRFCVSAGLLISTAATLIALLRLFRSHPNTSSKASLQFQFDWDPALPLWGAFQEFAEVQGYRLQSIDRRVKILSVPNLNAWEEVLDRYPLNIRKPKAIEGFIESRQFLKPPGAKSVRRSIFGFWIYDEGIRTRLTDEEAQFLHRVARNWEQYPFLAGGKRVWKNEFDHGPKRLAGPLDSRGERFWIV